MRATCSEPDCTSPVRGRGLCGTHYAYRRRHGTLPYLAPPTAGCSIDGCAGDHEARGLCKLHYQRLIKSGSVEQPLATAPDEERFWAKVQRIESGCWLWTAGISHNTGYGNVWWAGRTQSTHRIAYVLTYGEIPAELTLDHLCRVRHCVNPQHLEAVPFAVNNLRGMSASAENARKTHCHRGHEFTPANTYVRPDGRTSRDCLACRKESSDRANLRKKLKPPQ